MAVFWPGEFHGLYSLWDHKESDTTERLSLTAMSSPSLICMPLAFLGLLEFQNPSGKCAELDHTIWPPVKVIQLRSQEKIIRRAQEWLQDWGGRWGGGDKQGSQQSSRAFFHWCPPPGIRVIGTLRPGPTFSMPYAQKN